MRKNKIVISAICLIISAGAMLSACKEDKNSNLHDDVTTLKWCIVSENLNDMDRVLEEFNKKLYEKAGFKLEVELINGSVYNDKINMYIAANNDFDLAWIGYLTGYDAVVANEGLYDLTDMVEKSELKNTMPQYVWDSATINGRIYAIPNMQVLFEKRQVTVKKDLAQKYNLDISKVRKTEDIEPFLEKVRDNEPDIYPFGLHMHEQSFQSVDDYSMSDTINYCYVTYENGELTCKPYYENEIWRGKVNKLHDWYEKGFIRKDAAAVRDDSKDQLNGMYAAWVDHNKPGGYYEFKKQGNSYDICYAVVSQPYIAPTSSNATMIGVNAHSKHPQEAFKLIELMNTDKELYNMLVYGIEGVHYKKIGENRVTITDGSYGIVGWKLGNQFNAYFLDDQSEEDWKLTQEMNEESPKSKFIGFHADITDIKKELTQLGNVKKKYEFLLTGAEDPELYWEDYAAEMEAAGMEKVCKETRKQLEEFIKEKNIK